MSKYNSRGSNVSNPVKATRKSHRGGTLVGLFIGLVIGLLCALGVAWYLQKTPLPFLDKTHAVAGNEATTAPTTHAPASTPAPANSTTPASLPGKPGEKPLGANGEKPRFDFYKILPGEQNAASATANVNANAAKSAAADARANPSPTTDSEAAPAPVAVSESYYLQAGAFQKPVDADNLKAKLALMGLEVAVLEANVPDKGVMYRVRVGPYAKPDEMNRARTQLSQNGIQASVVKIKDKPVQ